jgi:hypothetical protein
LGYDNYDDYNTSLDRETEETTSLLETWRIINLMRVLGAVLGWVLVAVQPTKDYTARKNSFF